MEENKKETNSIGYIFGQIVGCVAITCLMAISVALTLKFIFWMF